MLKRPGYQIKRQPYVTYLRVCDGIEHEIWPAMSNADARVKIGVTVRLSHEAWPTLHERWPHLTSSSIRRAARRLDAEWTAADGAGTRPDSGVDRSGGGRPRRPLCPRARDAVQSLASGSRLELYASNPLSSE
jgi:hypothetical protein